MCAPRRRRVDYPYSLMLRQGSAPTPKESTACMPSRVYLYGTRVRSPLWLAVSLS